MFSWSNRLLQARLGPLAATAGLCARCDDSWRSGENKKLIAAAAAVGGAAYYAWTNRVESRAVIVDCGSGSTRLSVFETRNGKTSARYETSAVIASDALRNKELLDSFASSLPRNVDFLGATAGVRSKKLDMSPLSRRISGEARVLTTFEEARWELRAARECAGDDAVGLLSGGGMSIQFGNDDVLASAPLDTFEGRELLRKRGFRAGSVMHEWECRRRLVNATNEKLNEGRYVAIELAAKTLRRCFAGQDIREIDRNAALRGLEALIKTASEEKDFDIVVYAIHLKVVLELAFGPGATFVVLPPSEGQEDQLKPAWPLGLYLERYAKRRN